MTAIKLKSPVLARLNDEEFYQFCMGNRDLRIERDAQHQISFMPPTSSETGSLNSEIMADLVIWNRQFQLDGVMDL